MRTLTICAWFLLLVATVGCAGPLQANAFDGPDRSGAEVSRLQIDKQVRLVSIDGKPVAGIPGEWDSTKDKDSYRQRIVRLLPGTHRVVAGINPNTTTGNSGPMGPPAGGGWSVGVGVTYTKQYPGSKEDEQLEFTTEAGKTYILKLKNPLDMFTSEEKWNAIIYDADSPEFQKLVSRSHGRIPHAFPPAQMIVLQIFPA